MTSNVPTVSQEFITEETYLVLDKKDAFYTSPEVQSGIHYGQLVELIPRTWVPLNRKVPQPSPDYYNPYSLRYQVLCDQKARNQQRLEVHHQPEMRPYWISDPFLLDNQKDLIEF